MKVLLTVACVLAAASANEDAYFVPGAKRGTFLNSIQEMLMNATKTFYPDGENIVWPMKVALMRARIDLCKISNPQEVNNLQEHDSFILGRTCKEAFVNLYNEEPDRCGGVFCDVLTDFETKTKEFLTDLISAEYDSDFFDIIEERFINPIMEYSCRCSGKMMDAWMGCKETIGDADIWDHNLFRNVFYLATHTWFLDGTRRNLERDFWVDLVANRVPWEDIETMLERTTANLCQRNTDISRGNLKCYTYLFDTITAHVNDHMNSIGFLPAERMGDSISDVPAHCTQYSNIYSGSEGHCLAFSDCHTTILESMESVFEKFCVESCVDYYQEKFMGCCTASLILDEALNTSIINVANGIKEIYVELFPEDESAAEAIRASFCKSHQKELDFMRNPVCKNSNISYYVTPCVLAAASANEDAILVPGARRGTFLNSIQEMLINATKTFYPDGENIMWPMKVALMRARIDLCKISNPQEDNNPQEHDSIILGRTCKEAFVNLYNEEPDRCGGVFCDVLTDFETKTKEFLTDLISAEYDSDFFDIIEERFINPIMEYSCRCSGKMMDAWMGCKETIGDADFWDYLRSVRLKVFDTAAEHLVGMDWRTFWFDLVASRVPWEDIETMLERSMANLCQRNTDIEKEDLKCYSYLFDTIIAHVNDHMNSIGFLPAERMSYSNSDVPAHCTQYSNIDSGSEGHCLAFSDCHTTIMESMDSVFEKFCVKSCVDYYQEKFMGCCTASLILDEALNTSITNVANEIKKIYVELFPDDESAAEAITTNFLKSHQKELDFMRNPVCKNSNISYYVTPCVLAAASANEDAILVPGARRGTFLNSIQEMLINASKTFYPYGENVMWPMKVALMRARIDLCKISNRQEVNNPQEHDSFILGRTCKEAFVNLYNEEPDRCGGVFCNVLTDFETKTKDFLTDLISAEYDSDFFHIIEERFINPIMEYSCRCSGKMMDAWMGCKETIGDADFWDYLGSVRLRGFDMAAEHLVGMDWRTFWFDLVASRVPWEDIEIMLERTMANLCQRNTDIEKEDLKCYSYLFDTIIAHVNDHMNSIGFLPAERMGYISDVPAHCTQYSNIDSGSEGHCLAFSDCHTTILESMDSVFKKFCVESCVDYYQERFMGCCTASLILDEALETSIINVANEIKEIYVELFPEDESAAEAITTNFLKSHQKELEFMRNPCEDSDITYYVTPCTEGDMNIEEEDSCAGLSGKALEKCKKKQKKEELNEDEDEDGDDDSAGKNTMRVAIDELAN